MAFDELLLRLMAERPATAISLVGLLAVGVWNAAVTWAGFRRMSATMVTKDDLRVALSELRESLNANLIESYCSRREIEPELEQLGVRISRLERRAMQR